MWSDIWNVSYIELVCGYERNLKFNIWNNAPNVSGFTAQLVRVSHRYYRHHNCEDHSLLDFKSAVQYMKHFRYHFKHWYPCGGEFALFWPWLISLGSGIWTEKMIGVQIPRLCKAPPLRRLTLIGALLFCSWIFKQWVVLFHNSLTFLL